jgi:hypothetical protein
MATTATNCITVAILPRRFAPWAGRRDRFRHANAHQPRIASSQTSRDPSKSTSTTDSLSDSTIVATTIVTKSLSVMGSRTLPIGVSSPNRRAYQPSATSVTAAAASTDMASAGLSTTKGNAAPRGIRARLSSPGTRTMSRAT